jgi:hypothetical protein
MIDPLLQERIDDFKEALIKLCKEHRMHCYVECIGTGFTDYYEGEIRTASTDE